MTTFTTTSVPAQTRPGTTPRSRAWAWTGFAAAAAGLGGLIGSSLTSAVYDEATYGDAEAIVATLANQTPQLLAFHVLTMVGVVLLPVAAAGLHRRLADRLPEGSLLGPVAATGLLLVAVAGLLGAGLNTEFLFGVAQPEILVPESAAFYGHWVGTIPWLWVGAGVTGLALAAAAFRHRAVPRWIGVVALVLGALTVLFGVSPLQYMAAMTAPPMLLAVFLGFALGDRETAAARS